MALLISLSLACAAVSAEPKHTQNEDLGLPAATEVWTLHKIFSADFCDPCRQLREELTRQRVPFTVEYVREQPAVPAFPAVAYETTTGRIAWDNGERIRQGLYRLPKEPVVIIEYVTRGR